MRQCQGCDCENGIDDFIAIQICEECAGKLGMLADTLHNKKGLAMWFKTSECKPIAPCLAYDELGDSIGKWDGHMFESFTGGYSFDDEYSVPGTMVFSDYSRTRVCGIITHWMPFPSPPISDVLGKG